MTSIDIEAKEISPLGNPSPYISQQPIDRHLIEITDKHKSVFINAGIDSTCGKKRASITHTFMNGTIISLDTANSASFPVDNLLDSLTLKHPTVLENGEESLAPICDSDASISECCSHCGK